MKYLKKYNKLNESNSINKVINDILLEINDEDLWKADCWKEYFSGESIWAIIIQTVDEDEEFELEGQTPPSSVIETIERVIDFMNGEGFTNYKITFEMDEDDQFEEISLEEVSNLDVWPNNFIRIEFWK
jgi:hypothetical protein